MKIYCKYLIASLSGMVCGQALCAAGAVLNLNVAADTYLDSAAPNNNAGAHTWFGAGLDGVGGVRRGLFRFDLSPIPAGATITSVSLVLTVTQVPGHGFGGVDSTFSLYRLLAAWNEGTKLGNSGAPASTGAATWNVRMNEVASWTTAGAADDAIATASASTPVGSEVGAAYVWSGPGLRGDVQLWLSQPTQNFGWLLRSQVEAVPRTVRGFASRESGVDAGMLQVVYSLPNSPPTVALTNPANGASFVSPASVTLQAAASDSDGSVALVRFYDGTNSLGSATASPYPLAVTLYPGSHSLTAVATDNLGAASTSAPVVVTVTTLAITDPLPQRIPKGNVAIELQTILDGLVSPLSLAAPADGSGRLFVYDQVGLAWVVVPSGPLAVPLLDVRSRLVPLATYDERGLLGLATHPNFAQNQLLYTYTSEPSSGPADFSAALPPGMTNDCQSVIAEWRMDPAHPNQVDPTSRREILRIDKPYSNHNGGTLRFGPDGFLYFTLGDGGGANDNGAGHLAGTGNAQSLQVIYGKILRLDVNSRTAANGQYGIPLDNPFVGQSAVPEIYAYGLRNPFSFSFDRQTGQLYLGDVGQNTVEEVDLIVKGGNYGWNVREGGFWFDPNSGSVVTGPVRPVPPNLMDPIAQYDHLDGTVVIGGYVYRGAQLPALQGRYVFGDWGTFGAPSARLFYLDAASAIKEFILGADRTPGFWLKGFGEDANGELYLFASSALGPAGNTGRMLKIVPAPAPVHVTAVVPVNGTNVQGSWTGGVGPFALQEKLTVTDPTWMTLAVTNQAVAVAAWQGKNGFFRVADTAHQAPIPLTAFLCGPGERPTNNSAGTGLAVFSLDGSTLRFSIQYRGLTGAATGAHLHGPATTAGSVGVVLSLAPYAAGPLGTAGAFSGTVVLPDALKAMLLGGLTYVNVHTPSFPNGEIRGQIAPVAFEASLNGAHELPPVATRANALAEVALVGDQLTFAVAYRGLSSVATAAHIHGPAPLSSNAPVLVSLVPFNGGSWGTNGLLAGSVTLSPTVLAYLIDGQTYVNIHTGPNPGGEIRGQLVPQATGVPLSAALSGAAERPTPVPANGGGAGLFNLSGNTLTFSINYSNLSAPATMAHLHAPATVAQSAGVAISLVPFNGGAFGSSGTLAGQVVLTDTQRVMVLAGLTYVNVHTTNYPTGEIRGQIFPALLQSALSGVNERPVSVVSPGSGYAAAVLVGPQLTFGLTYTGLPVAATGARLQGPASLFAPGGVLIDLAPFNGGAFGTFGSLSGSLTLNPTNLSSVLAGQTYLNLTTPANTNGELRGQLIP